MAAASFGAGVRVNGKLGFLTNGPGEPAGIRQKNLRSRECSDCGTKAFPPRRKYYHVRSAGTIRKPVYMRRDSDMENLSSSKPLLVAVVCVAVVRVLFSSKMDAVPPGSFFHCVIRSARAGEAP